MMMWKQRWRKEIPLFFFVGISFSLLLFLSPFVAFFVDASWTKIIEEDGEAAEGEFSEDRRDGMDEEREAELEAVWSISEGRGESWKASLGVFNNSVNKEEIEGEETDEEN